MGALSGRRLPGADLSRQPEPVLARQGRDLSGRLVGHLDLPRAGQIPDGRLPAAAAGRRRRIATSPTTPTSRIGMNAASKNKEDAKTFLDWMATPEFATLYANALPGFFPLSKTPVKIDDDLAATIVGWRKECKSTIRNSYQILSRGTPNLENETVERVGPGHQRHDDAGRGRPSSSRTASTSGTSRQRSSEALIRRSCRRTVSRNAGERALTLSRKRERGRACEDASPASANGRTVAQSSPRCRARGFALADRCCSSRRRSRSTRCSRSIR